jgi:RimJ/RimL family protein N-acetyltransferase
LSVTFRVLAPEDVREISQWFEFDSDFPRDFSPFDWNITRVAFLSKVQDTITNKKSAIKFYAVLKEVSIVGLLLAIKPQNFDYFEIGYYIRPKERGKGYATEAVGGFTNFLFKNNRIMRIEAGTSSLNLPSQRLLEKLGFRREAVRQKTLYRNGKWEDSCLYAFFK